MSPQKRREWLDRLSAQETFLILFAETLVVPEGAAKDCLDCGMSVAASRYDAHLAASRLLSLRREKVLKTKSLHGVVIEHDGQGIVIAGPSGIGKTTAALRFVNGGANWIADDLAVIQNRLGSGLLVSGHPAIRRYVWTDSLGLQLIEDATEGIQIKKRTRLKAFIQIRRDSVETPRWEHEKMTVLGVKIKKISCRISNTGHFDENLLKKILKDL